VAPDGFGGGIATIFMVMPFLFILVGVLYIAVAADRRKRRQSSSVRILPVGAEHPLSHLRSKMKPVKPARQPDQTAAKQRRRRPEPPWLTKV
jgi:cbb3-type cytochrome oxidase subunit 3